MENIKRLYRSFQGKPQLFAYNLLKMENNQSNVQLSVPQNGSGARAEAEAEAVAT